MLNKRNWLKDNGLHPTQLYAFGNANYLYVEKFILRQFNIAAHQIKSTEGIGNLYVHVLFNMGYLPKI